MKGSNRKLGVIAVLDLTETWKMSWFGHVKRMGDQRYLQEVLDLGPDGRRPVGRHGTRWMKGVEEALERRETGLLRGQKNATYEDRDVWRRLVESSR